MGSPAPRFRDQSHMPGMECAHCGHESDAAAARAKCRHSRPKRVDVTEGLHARQCSDKGWPRGRWLPLVIPSRAVKRAQLEAERSALMVSPSPHFVVFANEKGGTGKSTSCVHTAVALAMRDVKVAVVDLDHRQRTVARYLENRTETARRRDISLPTPAHRVFSTGSIEGFNALIAELAEEFEVIVIDTPGRDDPLARYAAARANTLVTPMNDSFVDFDLIGQVDAESFKVRKLSFYSELIFETRKTRAMADGVSIDWVVLRNRLHHMEARNQKRVGEALTELSRRVGFRVIPGLSERVIFRELFPSGLTLLDRGHLGELGVSHVAARQELREMITGLSLPLPQRAAMAQSAA